MLNRSSAREDPLPYNRPSQQYHSPLSFQSRGRDNNNRPFHRSQTVPAPWAQSNSDAVAKFSNTEVWEQRPPNLNLPNLKQFSSFSSGSMFDLPANARHLEHIPDPNSRRRTSECGKIKCSLKQVNTLICNPTMR